MGVGGDDGDDGGVPVYSRVRSFEGDGEGGRDHGGRGGEVDESDSSGDVDGESGGGDVFSPVAVGGDDGRVGAVYSISGRRGAWVDESGRSVGVERNEGAAIQEQALGQTERFEQTSFLASLKSSRINIGGDLEITISVPLSEKYQALRMTDAPGVMLVFTVQRKRRGDAV